MLFLQVRYKRWLLETMGGAKGRTELCLCPTATPPPENNIYKTDIVVPNSLHMGWSKLPAYLCAESETEREIYHERTRTPIGSLPYHPLEKHTMTKLSTSLPAKPSMLKLS